jgi:hypothetical protein
MIVPFTSWNHELSDRISNVKKTLVQKYLGGSGGGRSLNRRLGGDEAITVLNSLAGANRGSLRRVALALLER